MNILFNTHESFNTNQLNIQYSGMLCVNVKLANNKAYLRSIFVPRCPAEENIKFTVKNPNGETASDTLKIKITD